MPFLMRQKFKWAFNHNFYDTKISSSTPSSTNVATKREHSLKTSGYMKWYQSSSLIQIFFSKINMRSIPSLPHITTSIEKRKLKACTSKLESLVVCGGFLLLFLLDHQMTRKEESGLGHFYLMALCTILKIKREHFHAP